MDRAVRSERELAHETAQQGQRLAKCGAEMLDCDPTCPCIMQAVRTHPADEFQNNPVMLCIGQGVEQSDFVGVWSCHGGLVSGRYRRPIYGY